MKGMVKWFDATKGYGFITGEDGADYFVHHTALPENVAVKEAQDVSFEPIDTDKGKQARNITVAG